MKKILFILFLTSTLIQGQTSNMISQEAFDAIKINGITLKQLKQTKGTQALVEGLFGNPNNKHIDVDGDFNSFDYEGLHLGFSSVISTSMILSRIDITNNQASITINGKTVTIGDNISLLGNVIVNNRKSGGKSIVFQSVKNDTSFISIVFDKYTNTITEIVYIEMT